MKTYFYSPGSWYSGDRPNLNWPAFLMRLFPEETVDGMRVKMDFIRPKFRRTYSPIKRREKPPGSIWCGVRAKYVTYSK